MLSEGNARAVGFAGVPQFGLDFVFFVVTARRPKNGRRAVTVPVYSTRLPCFWRKTEDAYGLWCIFLCVGRNCTCLQVGALAFPLEKATCLRLEGRFHGLRP